MEEDQEHILMDCIGYAKIRWRRKSRVTAIISKNMEKGERLIFKNVLLRDHPVFFKNEIENLAKGSQTFEFQSKANYFPGIDLLIFSAEKPADVQVVVINPFYEFGGKNESWIDTSRKIVEQKYKRLIQQFSGLGYNPQFSIVTIGVMGNVPDSSEKLIKGLIFRGEQEDEKKNFNSLILQINRINTEILLELWRKRNIQQQESNAKHITLDHVTLEQGGDEENEAVISELIAKNLNKSRREQGIFPEFPEEDEELNGS
jgi:hypothetical protein